MQIRKKYYRDGHYTILVLIKNLKLAIVLQNFRASPEKNCVVWKPGIIFQSPDFFKISQIFLFLWVF